MEDLKDIFTILHDGCIEECHKNQGNLILKVEIAYLAEHIGENHEYILLSLLDTEYLFFEPWDNPEIQIDDFQTILSLDPSIVSTAISKEGYLEVHCACSSTEEFDLSGGILRILCKGYELRDEDGNQLELQRLKDVSHYYWNEIFGEKAQR